MQKRSFKDNLNNFLEAESYCKNKIDSEMKIVYL
jgi:hypothetical protein